MPRKSGSSRLPAMKSIGLLNPHDRQTAITMISSKIRLKLRALVSGILQPDSKEIAYADKFTDNMEQSRND
jgi:hypothetical protein